ncbi:hypothetical protein V495_05574 [Pseudogymnoascus sp. VKM F-4514 (FW-929)]|nr:hypothetical protein V495_05574 [Pseudogymnoascus sp. VKM F-4514 (FW-929)]KFY55094.1 hypothetical protein V497_07209 [Pseudogymnoascus sp. VKM F-4516 (FW-969)]
MNTSSRLAARGLFGPANCNSQEFLGLLSSLNEAEAMLKVAIDRTADLYNWLNTSPSSFSGRNSLQMSTLRTFEAIFGEVYYGSTNPQGNSAGLARIMKVGNTATGLASQFDDLLSLKVDIFCDDSWLLDTDPQGNPPDKEKGKFQYFNPYENIWENFNILKGSCRDRSNLLGFVLSASPGNNDYLTLCQSNWQSWLADINNGNTFRKLSGNTYTNGQGHIQSFKSLAASTMIHELSHCQSLLGAGNHWLDEQCESLTGAPAYDWPCVTEIAKSDPSRAVRNAGLQPPTPPALPHKNPGLTE